jgi:outer membrane protein assembly factor BamB
MHRAFLRRLALSLLLLAPLPASAHDWANWRGPEQNGAGRDKDLPAKFSTDANDPESNLIWKAPYGARSTPIVMHGRVYLNNSVGEGVSEQERVLCLDTGNGKRLWEKRFNVYSTDVVSLRLGWTNLCGDPETGNVYYHGTQGDLVCFDKDGKVLWERQLTERDGRISGYGGRLTSPLVDGDLVIMGMINYSWGDQAIGGNRFLALNKRTGEPVWWSNPAGLPRNTYSSSPAVAVIHGQRLILSGCGEGSVVAMNAHTGKPVWRYPFSSGAVNAMPIVAGNLIYVASHNESPDNNVQGRVACLDAGELVDGKPKMVWHADGIRVRYTTPVLAAGRLYCVDEFARMFCLDAKTGKPLWRRPFTFGRNCRSSPVWADGKIYIGDVNSKFHILAAGPNQKLGKSLYEHFFESPTGDSDVEVSGNPAVADGRVYFTTQSETYCIGKKDHTAKAGAIPPLPKEAPVGEPAQVQILPADVTLQPGQSTQVWVHVLDINGREVSGAKAQGKWSLAAAPLPSPPKGPKAKQPPAKAKAPQPPLKGSLAALGKGTATEDGRVLTSWEGATLTAAANVPSQQGIVVFDAGKLGKATARVRVAPHLPYELDLSKLPDGASPGGWVNAQGKVFVTTLKDGSKALRRLNTKPSPLLARGNAYIGLPHMTDYTIEADVMGTKKGTYMPDVGVVANRYTLALWGNYQRLRLTSWEAIPRVDVPLEYRWEPGTWYRLKLTVTTESGKVVARGKVWPRGQEEPAEWSVQFADPTPNREGTPALYGTVTGFVGDEPGNDAFYQNVRVYPNRQNGKQ